MKLVQFAQFERATNLLENAPDDISDDVLLENNITRDVLEKINEGMLGDMVSKLTGWIGKGLSRLIPGNTLKEVDGILKTYEEAKLKMTDTINKEQNKIYKAGVELSANSKDANLRRKYDETKQRSDKAIEAIEAAKKSQLDAIYKRLMLSIKRSTSDLVKDYVEMKVAIIQEKAANLALENAEKNADKESEDFKKIEKEVADAKATKDAAEKAIGDAIKAKEASKKQSDKDKAANKVKKEEEAKNPKKEESKKGDAKKEEIPAKAEEFKAGTTLDYTNKDGKAVEVKVAKDQADQKPGEVSVKGDKEPFSVKIDKLENAGKAEAKAEEKLPTKATDFKADDVYEYTDKDGKTKDVKIGGYYQDKEDPGNVRVQNTGGDSAGYSVKIDKLKKKK